MRANDVKTWVFLAAVFCVAVAPILLVVFLAHAEEAPEPPKPPKRWPTMALIESTQRHHTDATEDQKKQDARMFDIARAVDAATSDTLERAVLLTIAIHETHLAAYVYEGRCADGPRGQAECDRGLAFGPWQLHAAPQVPVPATTAGQALRALLLFRWGSNSCRSSVPDEISAGLAHYGRGHGCGSTASSDARAAYARRIVSRL